MILTFHISTYLVLPLMKNNFWNKLVNANKINYFMTNNNLEANLLASQLITSYDIFYFLGVICLKRTL